MCDEAAAVPLLLPLLPPLTPPLPPPFSAHALVGLRLADADAGWSAKAKATPAARPSRRLAVFPEARVYDDALAQHVLAGAHADAGRAQLALRDGPAAQASSFWMAASQRPRSPVERAVAALHGVVAAELGGGKQIAGMEYWVRHQHPRKGVIPHYDLDVQAQRDAGNAVSPLRSSILYLTDSGGPTFIVDRKVADEGATARSKAQTAAFVYPRAGRFCVFDGDLYHGVLPSAASPGESDDGPPPPRATLLVNFWGARPGAPACADPDGEEEEAEEACAPAPVSRVTPEAAEQAGDGALASRLSFLEHPVTVPTRGGSGFAAVAWDRQ